MAEILTERLILIPLTLAQLRLYPDQPARLEQELGFSVSRRVVTDRVRRAIKMKITKMALAEEQDHPWYTYWLIVLKSPRFGAGLAGYKGLPNEHGEVEIGYGIDPVCQGQGFTTEAVDALLDWAFQSPGCRAVVAQHTKKENLASNRVLAKVGMHISLETDEERTWRIEKGEYLARKQKKASV